MILQKPSRLATADKIGAGFLAAVLILVVGVLSLRSANRALDASRWVAHAHEVLGRLDALLADLVDVENGQRGFVITGDERYLEAYDSGLRRYPDDLAAVRRLTADRQQQQVRLDSLAAVVAVRLAVSREVVRARREEGFAAASALVATNRGKQLMDDVRRRIGVMQAEERALLRRRTAERAESERRALIVIVVGAVFAFALVTLMIRVIQQDVRLQLSTARDRDALLEREQASLAQLAAIQRVTDAALAPLTLDDLLTELMQRLREVLAVDTACVLLVMRDGEHLELCKCVGPSDEIRERVRVPIGCGIEGRIATDRAAVAVEDVAAADVFDPVLRTRFASMLGAPLIIPARAAAGGAVVTRGSSDHRPDEAQPRESVIGVVHVETLQPRRFTQAETELLTLVAARIASAVERARLHQAQSRSEERFRLLVEGVKDYAIFMLDVDGRIASWNSGAERLKGYRAADILGESFARFYTAEDVARGVPANALATARANGTYRGEGWRVKRDGSLFWADVLITALHDDDDGHLIGFAKVTRDLTEQKRVEEAFVAAKEAAEAANAAKSRFLATMSHEIRTPINAMLGYAELLDMELDGPVTEAQRSRLARMRASGRHLLRLINDLLDLTKVEADQISLEPSRASATEAATAALALVYPQVAARSLAVRNRCVGDEDAFFLADPHRVEQVIANLLANAVKFTPPGGLVEVECGMTRTPSPDAQLVRRVDGPEAQWCYMTVADTGPGIPRELHDTVFDPFVQGDGGANTYTREHGGTGLGLAISRRLARLMSGDLTLDRDREAGAAFTLWLPTPTTHDEPTSPVSGTATGQREANGRGAPGLSLAGRIIATRAADIVSRHVARLRTELDGSDVPRALDVELEDHLGTLLAEFSRALVIMERAGTRGSRTLRDGTEIQRLVAERHGAQRASLGWSGAQYAREIAILREGIRDAVADELSRKHDVDVAAVLDVVSRLVAHAERTGERARRAAAGE